MWRASRERWPLIALGAIVSVATTALLVIRPLPLPSWLPGAPEARAGAPVDTPAALPDSRPPFSVTAGDGEIAVTWTTGAAVFYRAVAVAEVGDPAELPCRAAAAPSAGSARCVVTGVRNGLSYLVSVFPVDDGDSAAPLGTFRAVPRPALLTSADVVAWFDAGDYTGVEPDPQGPAAIGSKVLTLRDKSVHHHDATQQEAKRQPAVGQLGRLPALALDGDDVLTTDSRRFPAGDSPSTVVVVAANDDPAPDATCIHNLLGWGSDAVGRARIVHKGCGTALAFADTYGTWDVQQPTLPWSTGRPMVVTASFGAKGVAMRIDGALSYRWTPPAQQRTDTSTDGVVGLGGVAWAPDGGWQGRIGEILVFDRLLDATELNEVEDYLGARWQVTLKSP